MAVTKLHVICMLMVFVGVLLVVMYTGRGPEVHVVRDHVVQYANVRDSVSRYDSQDLYANVAKIVQQRNNISRELNRRQQLLSQKECESNRIEVAASGGWCAKTSTENGGQHKTDTALVPVLAKFLQGKKVASFGDGPGRYKVLLLETGLLKGYDSYDGAPFSEKTSEGRVSYLDLTLPQYGLPLYDWIVSLEVAEHIPKQFEHIYIDNIVRHAKEGIILSWAVPGQAGHSHVNLQPFEYVKQLFEGLGFSHDPASSKLLKDGSTLDWLKTNTNVYRRKDVSKVELLETFYV